MENLENITNTTESSDLKQIVANNLLELRKLNKFTQAEIAEKLNYSDKAISKWERGEALPDVTILVEIAKIYGVTLDYLVSNETIEEKEKYIIEQESKPNKIIITALAATIPWLISCLVYFYIFTYYEKNAWTTFIWPIPITFIILLVFNSVWGKKIFKYGLVSLLVWSILATLHLQFLEYKLWLIYILGVPAQIAIVLWSQLKKSHKKK